MEIAKVKAGHAFEHGGKASVLVFDGVAQPVAGGVKVSKQAFDVVFRGVSTGRAFDGAEDGGQIRVQILVVVGALGYIDEELAGIDKIALGLDGIIFDFRSDDLVAQLSIVDALIIGLDVGRKVLADEAIEERAEDILLKIPAIDSATYIVCDLPDLALQGGSLLGTGHSVLLSF